MKSFGAFRCGVVVALLFCGINLPGGHPLPPRRQPPGQRQANMVMLRFQDAIASERWDDALTLCSQRIRSKAAEWSTPKHFFTDTLPIEHVLAKTWGCWSCGSNFYGMFVTLSDYDVTPRLDWFWGLAATANGYEVDYPPVKLDEYIVKKKAALQEREDRTRAIRASLEPKARGLATRLTAVSERFVVGAPMLFQLELTNSGATSVHFQDSGIRYYPLTVLNERWEPVQYVVLPAQIGVRHGEVPSGSSKILAEKIDINPRHEIAKPGKYFVRFESSNLAIGERVPDWEPGRFGENDPSPSGAFGLLTVTNKFPSNLVEIDVSP
jgi:hypothetical protein